jgi:hypothetical protein
MKHPVKSDFHTVVTEAGVSVALKPTNSIYSFYRLADTNIIARLGPTSFAGVQHAGPDTDDYASDGVQEMARQLASEHSRPFGQFKTRHLRPFVVRQPTT